MYISMHMLIIDAETSFPVILILRTIDAETVPVLLGISYDTVVSRVDFQGNRSRPGDRDIDQDSKLDHRKRGRVQ